MQLRTLLWTGINNAYSNNSELNDIFLNMEKNVIGASFDRHANVLADGNLVTVSDSEINRIQKF